MQNTNLKQWQHSHAFGQDEKRTGELRTLIVIIITATMMVVEIATGVLFGSIALLADGMHMASHAAALTINVFAYVYARRQAHNHTFSFGTGKVNALGGFTGAVLLAIFALMMAWESVDRLLNPVEIAFNQAIFVAVLGLIVNGVSVLILGDNHDHEHDHDHQHDDHDHEHEHHDHNLRAAYLHVLADALTSLLAIFALLGGKFLGLSWMDPLMGLVGAFWVSKWSLGLIRTTSAVLLDKQGSATLRQRIQTALEASGAQVTDLHLWSIGPKMNSVIISLLAENLRSPDEYKQLLPTDLGLAHITIEVNQAAKR